MILNHPGQRLFVVLVESEVLFMIPQKMTPLPTWMSKLLSLHRRQWKVVRALCEGESRFCEGFIKSLFYNHVL